MREGAARKPLLFISFCSFVPFQIPTPVFFCGHTEKPRHRPAGFPRRRWRRKDDLTPRTAHHFRPTTAGTSLNGRHALAHRLRRDLPAALTSSSNRAAPLANPVNQSINALTPDIFCESLRGAGPGQATPRGSRNPLQQQHQCRSVRSVLFLLCSSFSLSRCTRWENMFKKNRCSPLFSFFFPLLLHESPRLSSSYPQMLRQIGRGGGGCPGTTERRSLRCRRCHWQSSCAHHRCPSTTSGGLHHGPPLFLRVYVCARVLFFSSFQCALGKSFGRALVHHGGDKNGPGTPEGRERDRGTFSSSSLSG